MQKPLEQKIRNARLAYKSAKSERERGKEAMSITGGREIPDLEAFVG